MCSIFKLLLLYYIYFQSNTFALSLGRKFLNEAIVRLREKEKKVLLRCTPYRAIAVLATNIALATFFASFSLLVLKCPQCAYSSSKRVTMHSMYSTYYLLLYNYVSLRRKIHEGQFQLGRKYLQLKWTGITACLS